MMSKPFVLRWVVLGLFAFSYAMTAFATDEIPNEICACACISGFGTSSSQVLASEWVMDDGAWSPFDVDDNRVPKFQTLAFGKTCAEKTKPGGCGGYPRPPAGTQGPKYPSGPGATSQTGDYICQQVGYDPSQLLGGGAPVHTHLFNFVTGVLSVNPTAYNTVTPVAEILELLNTRDSFPKK